jgi:homopolymeric O-antigen transport system permease protein
VEVTERLVIALARPFSDLWRFRELVAMLVERDLKVRYKRSVLGMGWTLINPLLQMVVYTLVFSFIMRVSVPAFPVFILSGLLPWTLVSVSIAGSSHCLLNNQGLIRKVAVPQMVWPMAVVASKLVDLLLSLVPFAAIAFAYGRGPSWSWIALVPAVIFATTFSVGLGLLFSSLTVFYRDMRHLTDILLQVWFYVTPVLYPASFLEKVPHPWIQWLLRLNPAAPVVQLFQEPLYEGRLPDPALLGTGALAAGAMLGLGVAVFLRHQDQHIHHF